ncbi:nucleoid occlusion factor SlmA [Ferrovum sp.]|uniref:nucleoid occlusion factor SlmA n=2 Tax=Ferrovum sp. TaxID=2609467 RepID=UPI0026271DAD|nr:nucleoid occlusion factor SlmA [Ferrovum sp.]
MKLFDSGQVRYNVRFHPTAFLPPQRTMSTPESPPSQSRSKAGERRQEILHVLASLLERPQPEKITTALLARHLNVSEAALYRHFASKAKMYEGLIEFIEQTLFTRINRIALDLPSGLAQVEATLTLLLAFSDKNPGMTRVLTGEVLHHENERLLVRIAQLCERLEASIRQSLRLAATHGDMSSDRAVAVQANLLMSVVIGRWHRFSSSQFQRSPLEHWDLGWALLKPLVRI